MGNLWRDLRHAFRVLLKNPGLTLIVAVTLALGIGANSAVFSVVNTFLFRPLPVHDPEQLTVLAVKDGSNNDAHGLSYLDYQDYRRFAGSSFQDIAAYGVGFVGLSWQGRAERATVSFVTGNYFTMVGVEPAYGRLIQPPEGDKQGADPVVVLGHSYWKRRFGGDPSIIGRAASVNGNPFTVIGVVPEKFLGTYALLEMDAYIPVSMAAGLEPTYATMYTKREDHDMRVLGRLKPSASLQQARASLRVVAANLEKQYPDTNKGVAIFAYPERLARPEEAGADRQPVVAAIFMSMVALVLLVACANVANILLVRGTVRQREVAIRAALGAGRFRLVRQLLTESVLLAVLGGVAGLLLGLWTTDLLGSIRLPGDLPVHLDFHFDWRVFGYISGLVLAAGVIAGILPALRSTKVDLNLTLREGGRSQTGSAGQHRLRDVLVGGQVAVSLLLLIVAGLFLRSLVNARTVDLGFRPDHVLLAHLDPGMQGYDQPRTTAFYQELERRMRALPGVESAALAGSVPMSYYYNSASVLAEGQQALPPDQRLSVGTNYVGSGYFDTMRIPLVRGRVLSERDQESSRRVAVINQWMSERLWPGQDPIGRRFSATGPQGPWLEVVGVVRNGKYGFMFEDPQPFFYAPLSQNYQPGRFLHLRVAGSPESMIHAVQETVHEMDPGLALFDVMSMDRSLESPNGFFLLRMGAIFSGVLGFLGLVLAVVGVYGVVSYAVAQRTHEIGIRMALGARARDILIMVLDQGIIRLLLGCGAGMVAALGVTGLLKNMLFGISARDPLVFGGVLAVLMFTGLLASFLPARRATRVDPMVALRYE